MSPSFPLIKSYCISGTIDDIFRQACEQQLEMETSLEHELASNQVFNQWWSQPEGIARVHSYATSLILDLAGNVPSENAFFAENIRTEVSIFCIKTPGVFYNALNAVDNLLPKPLPHKPSSSDTFILATSLNSIIIALIYSCFIQIDEEFLFSINTLRAEFPGFNVRIQSSPSDRTEIVAHFSLSPPLEEISTDAPMTPHALNTNFNRRQGITHRSIALKMRKNPFFNSFYTRIRPRVEQIKSSISNQIFALSRTAPWLFSKSSAYHIELVFSQFAAPLIETPVFISFDLSSRTWIQIPFHSDERLDPVEIASWLTVIAKVASCAFLRFIRNRPEREIPACIQRLEQGSFQLCIYKILAPPIPLGNLQFNARVILC